MRGNGKIIQELESDFRGAGWNVIKVDLGHALGPAARARQEGHPAQADDGSVDGEYQTFKSKDGAYVREHFFNTPELKALVADWSDDDIWHLNRGGHDPHKVYAAYHAAVNHKGQPTVILAKTIKGYGMGDVGRGAEHHAPAEEDVARVAPRASATASTSRSPTTSSTSFRYVTFPEGSPELEYMRARRMELGGYLPQRRRKVDDGAAGARAVARSSGFLKSTEDREISTTMAFVQILQMLVRDKTLGKHIVPIVPDESRTFGMEGMFRQLGIWNQQGQLYTPQDADQLMFYKENKNGQILQEGINEAGGMCDWIAAATSYSTHGVPMIPFYIFYSMFGFQRVGDLALGRGRHALARLPARRHRGTHDAERRRAAARGRPLAPDVGDGPELHLVRSDVRLRGRGDHPGRPAAHVRRAAGRLLLPDGDERELRASGDARGRGGRASSRACTSSATAPKSEGPARAAAGLGRDLSRGDRGGRPAEERLGRRVRTSGAARASPSSRATA